MAAASIYLPYTAYHADQYHVLPTAPCSGRSRVSKARTGRALLACRRAPVIVALLLFRGWVLLRGGGRFLCGFFLAVLVCGLLIVGILWTDDNLTLSIQASLSLSDWQPWQQPNPQLTKGFWTGVAWAPAYRLPVFIAFVAFVLATTFWPHPKNLAHLIALSSAILIGIQFWFADQGGVYVLWYLPLLLLMVFRPNCSDRLPPIAARLPPTARYSFPGDRDFKLVRSEPTSQVH